MANVIGLVSFIGLVAVVPCLTCIFAFLQRCNNSRVRLSCEIASVVIVVLSVLPPVRDLSEFNRGYLEYLAILAWILVAFFPVLYWTMVWYQAIETKLKEGAGCLGLLIVGMFFSVYVEIPQFYVGRLELPYDQVFQALMVFLVYIPLWIGLAGRLDAICRHSATSEKDNGGKECGQSTDAVPTQNAPPKEND